MRRAPPRLQAARLLGVDAAPDELGPGSTVREAGWRGAAGPGGGGVTVDHIVYGVEDLEAGVEELAGRLGASTSAAAPTTPCSRSEASPTWRSSRAIRTRQSRRIQWRSLWIASAS